MQTFIPTPTGAAGDTSGRTPEHLAPPLLPAQLPLMRPRRGRIVAGVARGIGMHLGVPVLWVRLLFVLLTCWFGVGALAYVALWIAIPEGDPAAEAERLRAARGSRRAPLAKGNTPIDHSDAPLFSRRTLDSEQSMWYAYTGLDTGAAADSTSVIDNLKRMLAHASKPAIVAGVGALLIMLAIGLNVFEQYTGSIWVPAALCLLGAALPWLSFRSRTGEIWVTVVGESLVFVAFLVFVLQSAFQSGEVPLPRAIVSGFTLLIAAICAVVPWMLTLMRTMGRERALKEREEERADMTAHLHDGVLQTLALIQLHAADEQQVFTLARSQERELRNWLYQERTTSDRSVSAGIKEIAAQVEDTHGKPIDVVTVGDARPSAQTDALLDAAAQAMVNAVTHGGEPISVYCEASPNTVEVFVRDHGEGFDIHTIAPERLGIRESIVGRIERRGGSVEIVSRPHWGTEVRMHMPLAADEPGEAGQFVPRAHDQNASVAQ